MPSLTATHAPKGLEGVVATNSSICYIDGEQGVLAYRGIDIHELADHSNFEETCYLLWFGKLPTQNELKEFRRQLAEERKLDPAIIDLLAHRSQADSAHGRAAHRGFRAFFLRSRRQEERSRRQSAQGLPPDFADCHDRGGL